ncbi:hypothetical protein Hanom_Chr16g01422751 [Helianthus anomalus]
MSPLQPRVPLHQCCKRPSFAVMTVKCISQWLEALGSSINSAHTRLSSSMKKFSKVIVTVFKTSAFPNMYSRNSISHFCHFRVENLMVVRFVSKQAGTDFGSFHK